MKRVLLVFALAALISCATPAEQTRSPFLAMAPTSASPTPPPITSPTAPTPSDIRPKGSWLTPTAAPSYTPSPLPTATPNPTTQGSSPAAALDPNAECKQLADEGGKGLTVLYVIPEPELRWDFTLREFRVGICNSLSVPLVPDSDFTLVVHSPAGGPIKGGTPDLPVQLGPGFHELKLGPWKPGLEDHVTVCVQRPTVGLEVMYSDQPGSRNFRPLKWLDGQTSHITPIKCGGNYS